jgi:hypothetical protein
MGMAEISLSSTVQRSSDVLFQELQGEAVLLDLKSGTYFGLDGTGTRIWQLLGENGSLCKVSGSMLDEYEVDEGRCTTDLLNLVRKLEELGLVTVSNQPGSGKAAAER